MRGLFAASNDFGTHGPYVLSKNSESRNIYSLFNTTRQDVEDATNAVRFSFGPKTTKEDMEKLLAEITTITSLFNP